MDAVYSFILGLIGIISDVFDTVDHLVSNALNHAGIPWQGQIIVLLMLGIVLILLAIRFLGNMFGVLIAILLMSFLLFHESSIHSAIAYELLTQ
jgi:hypothetical protein